jgi:hypothetical protein
MRKLLKWSAWTLLAALLLAVLAAYFYPGDTFEQLVIGDGAGYWINCGVPPRCRVVLPFSPYMSGEEREFLAKLEAIPTPPATPTPDQIITLMGRPPDKVEPGAYGLLQWNGVPGFGPDEHRFVMVSFYEGQISRIRWQTDHFGLFRKFEVGPRFYKGGGKPKPA